MQETGTAIKVSKFFSDIFFTCGKANRSMFLIQTPLGILEIQADRGNIPINSMVIMFADLKSSVKFVTPVLRPSWPQRASYITVISKIYMNTKDIEVIEQHMPISHCPCCRRSVRPFPSCLLLAWQLRDEQTCKLN